MSRVFFGYPSRPGTLRETLATGAQKIRDTGLVDTQTWEELRPSGNILIDRITDAIDAADVAAFDVTGMNTNVLFELGYAIGARKRLWLLLNDRSTEAQRQWDAVRTLTTIGYTSYINSDDIRCGFLKEQPHLQDGHIFDRSIRANLSARGASRRLLYFRNIVETDADRYLARDIAERERSRELVLRTVDPDESTGYTLPWYGQKIYEAIGVVVHLARADYQGATTHNARASLVAGLAHGMGRPVLILSETGSVDPIDYRDIHRSYDRAAQCVQSFDEWFDQLDLPASGTSQALADVELDVELSGLRLGEHVAENEADELDDYFIRTAEYEEVLRRDVAVFVGRKGVGKTANLFRASEELKRDRRNLVCVIKPQGYDLTAVANLMRNVGIAGKETYVADGMWRYLILTEIAREAAGRIKATPAPLEPGSPEMELVRLVDLPDSPLQEDFSVRLEGAVERLQSTLEQRVGDARPPKIAEVLHGQIIGEVLRPVAAVCADYDRIAVLIDNLDKSWDRSAEIEHLVQMILGLLSAIGTIQRSIRRGNDRAGNVTVSLAVFLRSDIFHYVLMAAREPDKIPTVELRWTDPDLLLRVVEERFRALRGSSDGLFDTYFTPTVDGMPIREFISTCILPRPRDLVHLCNASIFAAVNHRHPVVDVNDLRDGLIAYSQFALESLRVENGISQDTFEDVVFEFAGCKSILLPSEIRERIQGAGVMKNGAIEEVIAHLARLSFVGYETKNNEFAYVENPHEIRRLEALSRGFERNSGRPSRFRIHPAYWPYLEIDAHPDDQLQLRVY